MGPQLLILDKKLLNKLLKRSILIFLSGFNSIIILVGNLIISYYVISFTSSTLWGGFVYIIIFLDMGFNIISWGSMPYLIKEFSLNPHKNIYSWQVSLKSRTPILLASLAIIFLLDYPISIKIFLFFWSVSKFLYQCFDSIILFNRDFKFSLIIELIGFSLIILPIAIAQTAITLELLVVLYTFSMCFRCISSSFKYKVFFSNIFKGTSNYSIEYLIISFPFLLITLGRMLQTKIDLYNVAYFLDNSRLAQYQLFIGFLGFSQFIAQLLLTPFEKSIFRLNKGALRKMNLVYLWVGVFASLGLEIIAYFLFYHIYKFSFSFYMYLFRYLYMLMFYFYLWRTYEFRKVNKQFNIAIYSLAAGGLNFLFGIFLIPRFDIEGALISGLVGQGFLTFILHISFKKEACETS